MNEVRITECPSWSDPRRQVMKTPDDVAAMVRLKACGWGIKRIARELGCSNHTVKGYVTAGGPVPFKAARRAKTLDGHEDWLRERFVRHRRNADVVRQDLAAEKGLTVSLRTLQRAVAPYRQALRAEALATTRFETPPGRQLQIDFGERLVEIAGAKVKAFVFVATLGHSRRLHVRAFRQERLARWERKVANARTHGTTGEAPIVRFERDEAHRLKPLGSRPSFGSVRELSRIVGNDCAVEIDTATRCRGGLSASALP